MNKEYITYLQSNSMSNHTINDYTKYINMALNYIGKPESEVTYIDLLSWKNSFTNLKPNSQNIRISAVKNYFGFLKKAGIISSNPTIQLEKQKVRDCDVKQKPYIEAHYLRDMVNNTRTVRDRAIVLLFATTGLRVSELTNITLDDYKNLSGEDNRELTIIGKGNKKRKIYIVDEAKEAIDYYLMTRCRPMNGCDKLFLSFQGGQIHSNNLTLTIKNIAKKAGVPYWQDMCCHALRAGYATTKHAQGESIKTIQKSLGHSKLETTLRYIKDSQSEINASMKNVAF